MALRNVLQALNDTGLIAAQTESRLPGEGVTAPHHVEMYNDEASDAPMMVLSRINES